MAQIVKNWEEAQKAIQSGFALYAFLDGVSIIWCSEYSWDSDSRKKTSFRGDVNKSIQGLKEYIEDFGGTVDQIISGFEWEIVFKEEADLVVKGEEVEFTPTDTNSVPAQRAPTKKPRSTIPRDRSRIPFRVGVNAVPGLMELIKSNPLVSKVYEAAKDDPCLSFSGKEGQKYDIYGTAYLQYEENRGDGYGVMPKEDHEEVENYVQKHGEPDRRGKKVFRLGAIYLDTHNGRARLGLSVNDVPMKGINFKESFSLLESVLFMGD